MKKFILICLLTSFIPGIAQEKKISFAKEFTYKMEGNTPANSSVKMYVSNNNDFFTNITFKDVPMYLFTDALATSPVSLELNNRLNGAGIGNFLWDSMMSNSAYEAPEEEYAFESKKLNTQETILGIPCKHYLINFKSKKQNFTREDGSLKVCIDETSPYDSFTVFNGLVKQYLKIPKLEKSGLKGFILKLAPEKDYDKEYLVMKSITDSKDIVYIDHKKIITDRQRKRDSLTLAYQKQMDEYNNMTADSAVVAADSAAVEFEEYAFVTDYVSDYKKNIQPDGDLAIHTIHNDKLWKGLPKHCTNFEKSIPQFNNKELKEHLKNYTGQMCDMYLSQFEPHSVGIKSTLDEIRREILYLNEIQGKLEADDQKKLNNYLNNLD
ncbi:hypothetical protein EGY07_16255 [Chryseobacterium indologenes]|uniref:hypothetical protein n=1 Tax=Chryseobacterium indologenes TaxID=253 RepID=UPI000F4FEA06|nr:hypothetical protein [Chryseobacterium indologenes]AYZ36998.1 hypothetical protein EGY07_16255 [Chryseobacterium indologenes]MBF6645833.1 hypothetical protein [Chryseobacterium indologenes]MBU3047882.1 hypothetical protein [Chryseobacterium indologenes]MEB4762311.1 hypothetical protein [Chryseobacterium indologenes]QQQ70499.1 hypothetical protein JHW31_18755 [Chryseobacterium indologenes]